MQPLSHRDAKEGQIIVPRGNGGVEKGPMTHCWPHIKSGVEPRRPLTPRPSPRGDSTPGCLFRRTRTIAWRNGALGRVVKLTTGGGGGGRRWPRPCQPTPWAQPRGDASPGKSENSAGPAFPVSGDPGEATASSSCATLLWQLEGGFRFVSQIPRSSMKYASGRDKQTFPLSC